MKKILITGASSGLMKELIKKIKNKYFIYVTVHTKRQLKNVEKLYEYDQNIKCFKLDVTDEKDIEKLKNIDVDILISNAAIGYGGSIINMDIDKIRDNYEINVFSNFNLVQEVLKKMLKKNNGKIIIMSSLAGIIPIPFLGSYCSTKASIIKLTECLKKELKILNSNIKISLIEPGMYKTGFNKYMFENKYNNDFNNLFKEELELIHLKENIMMMLLERKNYKSIVKQIKKAITNDNKFLYRAPLFQSIGAKIYNIFN